VRIVVRVTPRARRSELGVVVAAADGKPVLSVRLVAVAVDGAANRALIAFLADRLDLPAAAVRIVAGGKSRIKTVRIDRISPAAAEAALAP